MNLTVLATVPKRFCIRANVFTTIRVRVPRHPACAMPTAGVATSKMKIGTQSAVNMPKGTPRRAETRASASGRCLSSVLAV